MELELSELMRRNQRENRNPYITYESQGQRTIFMVLYIIYGIQCEVLEMDIFDLENSYISYNS